ATTHEGPPCRFLIQWRLPGWRAWRYSRRNLNLRQGSVSMRTLQQSLEEALVENPDDLAAHSASADYLSEQGDPRGESISVQLALEDPGRPAKERRQLQQRENELLEQHARQWLGELGPLLVGDWSGEDKPYHYQFARGWLGLVRVLPFPDAILAALA